MTGVFVLTLAGTSGGLIVSLTVGLLSRSPFLPRKVKFWLYDFLDEQTVLPGQIQQNIDNIVRILKESFLSMARTSAMILLILLAAFTLQFAFASVRISVGMVEWVAAFELTQLQLIFVLAVFACCWGPSWKAIP